MPTVTSPVIHLPIPILEFICDGLAADVSRLGRILAAMRSEAASSSRLAEIVSAIAPEVIPAVPLKCKHGLREAWCATCVALEDPKRCVLAGRLKRLVSAKDDAPKAGFIENRYVGCAAPLGSEKLRRVELKVADAVSLAEYASREHSWSGVAGLPTHWKEFVSTRWIETQPDENGCKFHPLTRLETNGISRNFSAEWHRRTNWCDSCIEYVEQDHSCEKWQEKKAFAEQKHASQTLAERQNAAKLQGRKDARREAWEQRRHAALVAQGLYSPEAFDVEIIRARRGTVEAEVMTKFDRDLSRKGNKYRIQ